MLIVDDALLLAVLAGVAADDVHAAVDRNEVFTTGCWYWRLSRALHDGTLTGALSRALQDLSAEQQARVVGAVPHLPRQIGLLSLRQLIPVMTALEAGRRLNLLTAEAIAAAVVLDATIMVTTQSPILTESCSHLRVDLRVVAE